MLQLIGTKKNQLFLFKPCKPVKFVAPSNSTSGGSGGQKKDHRSDFSTENRNERPKNEAKDRRTEAKDRKPKRTTEKRQKFDE